VSSVHGAVAAGLCTEPQGHAGPRWRRRQRFLRRQVMTARNVRGGMATDLLVRKLDMEQAFALLRTTAGSTNRRPSEMALDVVEGSAMT